LCEVKFGLKFGLRPIWSKILDFRLSGVDLTQCVNIYLTLVKPVFRYVAFFMLFDFILIC